jgi:hypothetical protein
VAAQPLRPALKESRFDLDQQEGLCRLTLAHPDRGIRVFVVPDDPREVGLHIFERLQEMLTEGQPPLTLNVTLNPRTKDLVTQVRQIRRHGEELDRRHVLVNVGVKSGVALDQFLTEVKHAFGPRFAWNLVLLVVAPGRLRCSVDHVALPRPQFAGRHLDLWVDEITAGRGWPTALVRRVKLWLRAQAGMEESLEPEVVYNVLRDAMTRLGNHADHVLLANEFPVESEPGAHP